MTVLDTALLPSYLFRILRPCGTASSCELPASGHPGRDASLDRNKVMPHLSLRCKNLTCTINGWKLLVSMDPSALFGTFEWTSQIGDDGSDRNELSFT